MRQQRKGTAQKNRQSKMRGGGRSAKSRGRRGLGEGGSGRGIEGGCIEAMTWIGGAGREGDKEVGGENKGAVFFMNATWHRGYHPRKERERKVQGESF